MNLSKLNRITHRDLGYLIAGLAIIYSISGIALNHKNDWNPNYVFEGRTFTVEPVNREAFNDGIAKNILAAAGIRDEYKAFHFPSGNQATIFINGGFVEVDVITGRAEVRKVSKRPLFYQFNFLHYNPGKWWKYFSDIFCFGLILVTVSGLFIAKGKHSITKRGAILTLTGILLPLMFLLLY